jgi:CheY-like chemotaxis protein
MPTAPQEKAAATPPAAAEVAATDATQRQPAAARGGAAGPPLRVLLVDDHEEAVTALHALLEIWGHEVRSALDGPSALAIARELAPQVVLLDIGLPEMDGWEVARRLRRRPETAAATLVALTGYGQDADRARSRDAGFDHHLVKPVNPQKLKERLAEWFQIPPHEVASALDYTPSSGRQDVEVMIRIQRPDEPDHGIDDAERQSLELLKQRLKELGVPEGQWHERPPR